MRKMVEAGIDKPGAWVGRLVRTIDEPIEQILGPAVVLCVDDTAYAPSAWIKYEMAHPVYRSVDLSNLEDISSGQCGPRWGSGAMIDAALSEQP